MPMPRNGNNGKYGRYIAGDEELICTFLTTNLAMKMYEMDSVQFSSKSQLLKFYNFSILHQI